MKESRIARRGVTRRFIERTLRGVPLGFEAYAWAAHRVSGLVLLIYLILHLFTLSSINSGGAAYDQTMKAMDRPLIKAGELILIWVVLFHALNGFRLILLNLIPELNHRRWAYSIFIASLILSALTIPVIF